MSHYSQLGVLALVVSFLSLSSFSLDESSSRQLAAVTANTGRPPCSGSFKTQRDACWRKHGVCGIAYTETGGKRQYVGCSNSRADRPATYGKGKILGNEPYKASWTNCFFNTYPCYGSQGSQPISPYSNFAPSVPNQYGSTPAVKSSPGPSRGVNPAPVHIPL